MPPTFGWAGQAEGNLEAQKLVEQARQESTVLMPTWTDWQSGPAGIRAQQLQVQTPEGRMVICSVPAEVPPGGTFQMEYTLN